jgi:WbqC-like protein family.
MKLAVMQPYFFPYLGYFQLLHAVDRFVSYDDVNFIKQGWINRNFILMGCQPLRITVPVSGASSFKTIAETPLSPNPAWQGKLLKTLSQAYAQAPFFNPVFTLAESVVRERWDSVAGLALGSIQAVANYLGIKTEIRPSATQYDNRSFQGTTRVLDICRREGAAAYYNLPGGQNLYDPSTFSDAKVELRFIQPGEPRYRQFACAYVPHLSILDVLMFNDRETVSHFLADYRIK